MEPTRAARTAGAGGRGDPAAKASPRRAAAGRASTRGKATEIRWRGEIGIPRLLGELAILPALVATWRLALSGGLRKMEVL
jgi:hypothetical protein